MNISPKYPLMCFSVLQNQVNRVKTGTVSSQRMPHLPFVVFHLTTVSLPAKHIDKKLH